MRWLCAVVCAACSSGSIGGVGSHGLDVARTVAKAHAATPTDRVASLDVTLTDDGNFPCENVGRVLPSAARSLALRLFSVDGGTFEPPAAPGAYRVVQANGQSLPDGRYGFAIYVESDPLCHVFAGNEIEGRDGTVTLSRLSPDVAGSFDLTLKSGDRFAGNFQAPLCAGADGGTCR